MNNSILVTIYILIYIIFTTIELFYNAKFAKILSCKNSKIKKIMKKNIPII